MTILTKLMTAVNKVMTARNVLIGLVILLNTIAIVTGDVELMKAIEPLTNMIIA